jgi:hypothetical protein
VLSSGEAPDEETDYEIDDRHESSIWFLAFGLRPLAHLYLRRVRGAADVAVVGVRLSAAVSPPMS